MRLAGQRSVAEATDVGSGEIEKDCSEGSATVIFAKKGRGFSKFRGFPLAESNAILFVEFSSLIYWN